MFNKKQFPRLVTEINGNCGHSCETCNTMIYHDNVWQDEDGWHKESCNDVPLCGPCRDREARHLWHIPNMTIPEPLDHSFQNKENDDGEGVCDDNCIWCDKYFNGDFSMFGCECIRCELYKREHIKHFRLKRLNKLNANY